MIIGAGLGSCWFVVSILGEFKVLQWDIDMIVVESSGSFTK